MPLPSVPVQLATKVEFEQVQEATALLLRAGLTPYSANDLVYQHYMLHNRDTWKMLDSIKHYLSLRRVIHEQSFSDYTPYNFRDYW